MAAFRRFANLFRRRRVNRDIADELQSHLDLRIDANLATGMSPQDARRDALLRFGNPTATRERVASADAALSLSSFWRDIRYAARQLRKSPGFTLTVFATMAIGIGANVTVYSSMDAVVFRPLAVPALDRVVAVAEQQQQRGNDQVAMANFADWQRQSRSFEELAAYTDADFTLTGAGDAAQIHTSIASPGFFSALRAQTLLGRLFDPTEFQPGRDGVALLNYTFWQSHFASSQNVIGQTIELDQRQFVIVGVLPRAMQYPAGIDMILPLAPAPAQLADRTAHTYKVIGRLRDGVSVAQAQSELQLIAQHLARAYPATNQGWTVHIEPLLDAIEGDLTPLYYRFIMGATLFVLLVVCANIANLQLARGVSRRPEIAMRTALGASRTRIMRQLFTENILLALLGAVGGIAFASLYLHLILIAMPARIAHYIPGWYNTSINRRALLLSLVLAIGAGFAAGLIPAVETLRVRLVEQLRAGSRQATGAGRSRLRSIFAVAQISMAVALVIGAALMAKGMNAMLHQADIYNPDKVLTLKVSLPAKRYETREKRATAYASILDKVRNLPGVDHAEIAAALPFSDEGWSRDTTIENRPTMPGKIQNALYLPVSQGYFQAFHIPVLSGRAFAPGDSVHSTPVALVSRRFADLYFKGENPVGHRVRVGDRNSDDPWLTIVGVVDEATYALMDDSEYLQPAIYVSSAQLPAPDPTLVVFTSGDPLALATPARKAIAAVDAGLPVDPVETYRRRVRDEMIGIINAAVMLAFDALIALLLAAIGIFGVMANLVGERTREIGVRLAMGASRRDVLAMILRRASVLTGIGVSLGLVSAFVLARLVANLLRGVRPDDPIVFTVITVTIVLTALGSSLIPARRAARVDPMQALRAE